MKIKPTSLIIRSAFLKSREGSTAAELAISVMLLTLILFCITTFGWMFYLDNNWETAAREAARRLASGEAIEVAPPGPVTCDSAQALDDQYAVYFACNELPNWGAIITVDASSLCDPDPLLSDQAVSVTVSANAEDVALTDIFGFFNGVTLDATVEMRQEVECPPPPS
jgi:Flp pilus assembly protein TadG